MFYKNSNSKKKAALCFFISYNHTLAKEDMWRGWVQENADIIDVYFHYTDLGKIQSPWILAHVLPSAYIVPTSYYHMVPAYLSALFYAFWKEPGTQWFCLLTESCVPLVSPAQFRSAFLSNSDKSIFKWSVAWWNIDLHRRANLRLLPPTYRLAHDPYFILCRQHVKAMSLFYKQEPALFKHVCDGGLANESLFAIALRHMGVLDESKHIVNTESTATDWARRASPTSPHLFKDGDPLDIDFIRGKRKALGLGPLFLRKVHKEFPDAILFNDRRDKDNDKDWENRTWVLYYAFFGLGIMCGFGYYAWFIVKSFFNVFE